MPWLPRLTLEKLRRPGVASGGSPPVLLPQHAENTQVHPLGQKFNVRAPVYFIKDHDTDVRHQRAAHPTHKGEVGHEIGPREADTDQPSDRACAQLRGVGCLELSQNDSFINLAPLQATQIFGLAQEEGQRRSFVIEKVHRRVDCEKGAGVREVDPVAVEAALGREIVGRILWVYGFVSGSFVVSEGAGARVLLQRRKPFRNVRLG